MIMELEKRKLTQQKKAEIRKNNEELVELARAGDKTAFERLVKNLEPIVAGTIYGMLGNSSETKDVGQETFIRFYKALSSFRGDSTVSSYITRIAINLSLNALKKRKRWYEIFKVSDDSKPQEFLDYKAKPEDEKFEQRDLINFGLKKLRVEYRLIIVLRFLDGYSTSETAEILKLPIGTVTSRLARAQIELKEILAPFMMSNK